MFEESPRVCVYSCIASSYDEPLSVDLHSPCVTSYVLFTDDDDVDVARWNVRGLASPASVTRPCLVNRYHKFFPHRVLDDVDISIYIDGNIQIISDITPLIENFISSGAKLGIFSHPQRDNIIEEYSACSALNKFGKGEGGLAVKQIEKYARDGYKLDSKLFVATVLLRKHDDTEDLDRAMELWWKEINTFSSRDQLSLPYVLWKTGLPCQVYEIDIFNNPYFRRSAHRREKLTLHTRVLKKLKCSLGKIFRLA